ncbi:MAG: hypothetical protein CBB86_08330 [Candidatus Endolissoclinum sp. TMED26]|nr:MAG: hypothetical protein CBB86_08330 [Candidatus Endolissoclinum sp. TMED26]
MRIFVAASIHAVPAAASDLMNRPAHSSFIRSARGPLSAVCRAIFAPTGKTGAPTAGTLIFQKSAYTLPSRYFISSAAAAIVKRYNG